MSTLAVGTIKSISSAAPVFQNTSGTEKGQLIKIWCHFDATGVSQTIKDSFNVSSLTDQGVGFTDVNFTNAMSDTNYCAVIYNNARDPAAINAFGNDFVGGMILETGKIKLSAYNGTSFTDSEIFNLIIIGDN